VTGCEIVKLGWIVAQHGIGRVDVPVGIDITLLTASRSLAARLAPRIGPDLLPRKM
jgi:hypothetical protein